MKAYKADIKRWAAWLGPRLGSDMTPDAAVYWLLAQSSSVANATVMEWLNSMADEKRAPATRNRRLETLRSITKLSRMLGVTTWQIELSGARAEPVRDNRGPSEEVVGQLLQAAAKSPTPERDVALLVTAVTLGLRRAELASLEVADFDPARATLTFVGKGGKRAVVTVPEAVCRLLVAWIHVREAHPEDSRLFQLNQEGVYALIKRIGRRAGVKIRPHGLRHAAVTIGLDALDGDVRKVRSFSRHAKVETVMRYDDSRRDDAGTVANAVAKRVLEAQRGEDVSTNDRDDQVPL